MVDVGLYRASIEIKCDSGVGGATVTADLVVDATNGHAYGSGKITQALPWPNNEHPISHISGQVRQPVSARIISWSPCRATTSSIWAHFPTSNA